MFAYIQGTLAHKDPTYVVVDVQGVGYEIRISLNTYEALEKASTYKLHTYLHVKEDAQTLFGFAQPSEKKLFLDLLSISGVGPSLALTLLSSMQVEELKAAIANEDAKTVQRVKGIGAKTAQRIVLELADKIRKEGIATTSTEKLHGLPATAYNTLRSEALSALMTLGFARAAADKSIDKVMADWQKNRKGEELRLEDVIKQALKTT
uniref:Holliday junction branch migration complex subunit RuvA n=1 Tax=Roseihalotalea indica TaxID=2867963 RepID=A0AA49JK73_9BACT|nr:Holliday junction branch migration protein RuvA [Tunicatimonas sp. TK19036]